MTETGKMMTLFGVSREDLQLLVKTALSDGGDFADLYFEHSIANELSLRDSEVNSTGTHVDYGMGVRVLFGDQTGYAYTEVTTLDQMLKAAKVASKIALHSKENRTEPVTLNGKLNGNLTLNSLYKIKIPWEETEISQKIPYLKELNELIFSADERVSKVMARISDSNSSVLYYNSEGVLASDIRPMFSLVATCIMESNGRVENGSSSRSFRAGFEFLNSDLIREIAGEVVKKTSFLFNAVRPNGGEMPVVM